MNKEYQIIDKNQTRQMALFLADHAQLLLPMVELVETAQVGIHALIEQLGRATIEAVLEISVSGVAGQSHQGKAGGEIVRHGKQSGVVPLTDRKVRIARPRLRNRGGGVDSGLRSDATGQDLAG